MISVPAPIMQGKLHFPCVGFANYPFVELPPRNDCKQSFSDSKFIFHHLTAAEKYAVPLYRLEQEFQHYGLNITRQNMANWCIRLGEEYLSVLYDHLHKEIYNYHVIQADEPLFS